LSYVERREPAIASELEEEAFAEDRLNAIARESLRDPVLSIVIPVFNEEASLDLLYGELIGALDDINMSCEIIFVDDGSEDSSVELLHAFEIKDTRVRVIRLDANHGQSTAFDAGFRAARGAYTATLDADLQNDPADLSKLLPLLAHADVVNGVRASRCDSLTKRVSSKIANGVRSSAPSPQLRAIGTSPRMVVRVVMRMGRRRRCPAERTASNLPIPFLLRRLIASMRTIELLTTIPASMTEPIRTMTVMVVPVR